MIITNSLEKYAEEKLSNLFWLTKVNPVEKTFFKHYLGEGFIKFGVFGLYAYSPPKDTTEYSMMLFVELKGEFWVYQMRFDIEVLNESENNTAKTPDSKEVTDYFESIVLLDLFETAEIGINSEQWKKGPYAEPEQKMYEVK